MRIVTKVKSIHHSTDEISKETDRKKQKWKEKGLPTCSISKQIVRLLLLEAANDIL